MVHETKENKSFQKISSICLIWFIPCNENKFIPKILYSRILFYLIICLIIVKVMSLAIFMPFPKNWLFADITRIELLQLLNDDRTNNGLHPLKESEKLNQAAYLKAQDMVKNEYFAHYSPQGVTPWFWFSQAGYKYQYAGENLAIGFWDSRSVYNAWINSRSHKENLLNPYYQEVGYAVLQGFGGTNTTVIVQLFGSPQIIEYTQIQTPSKIPPQTLSKQIETPVNETPVNQSQEIIIENQEIISEKQTQRAQVLPQFSGYPIIQEPQNKYKSGFHYFLLNFIIYDNNIILRYVSYSLLSILMLIALASLILGFNGKINTVLTLKSLFLIVMIYFSIFIDREIIGEILPHYIVL